MNNKNFCQDVSNPECHLSGLFLILLMRIFLGTLIIAALPYSAALATSAMSLDVQGTEFVVTMSDGSQRRSNELVGVSLQMPNGSLLRIDSVESETLDDGTTLWMHALSVRSGTEWQPLCKPDGAGRALGFPFPGTFSDTGHYIAAKGLFSLSCTSGAQAKCIRFGYMPWKLGAKGVSLSDHYNACIRMVRADYCGDQEPHTVNGTSIDIYDDIGVQKSDRSVIGMSFEAGWAPEGAVCINHLRIRSQPDPRKTRTACPRLETSPKGSACSESWARKHGAILFNRSK